MWMGSKVPPRIPVRTGSRIGARRRHQAKRPGDVGVHAIEPRHRIHVCAAQPCGEVDSRPAVGTASPGDDLPPLHPLTLPGADLGKIRHRDLEAGNRLDGHRLHPRHRTGECDLPGSRGADGLADLGCEVDPPMARILPHRGVAGHDGTVHRRHETHRCDGENCEHLTPLSSAPNVSPPYPCEQGGEGDSACPPISPKMGP